MSITTADLNATARMIAKHHGTAPNASAVLAILQSGKSPVDAFVDLAILATGAAPATSANSHQTYGYQPAQHAQPGQGNTNPTAAEREAFAAMFKGMRSPLIEKMASMPKPY